MAPAWDERAAAGRLDCALWAGSCMATASATTDIMRCARAVVATANSAPRRPRRGRRRETTVDAPRARGEVQLETRARLSTRAARRVPGPGTSIASWGRRFYPLTETGREAGAECGRRPTRSGTGRRESALRLPAAGPGGLRGARWLLHCGLWAVCCAHTWQRGALPCGERDRDADAAHISLTFRSRALDMAPRCTHTHTHTHTCAHVTTGGIRIAHADP